MTEEYYHDYPNEPIGGDNPYYRCSYCKRSDPEINGYLERHEEWCEYRIKKTGGTGMTKNKQLTEYIKEVLNLANDNVEVSVYDEDNNTDDLSNGIVKVRVEKLK